jgi:hypothetical protein
MGAALLDHDFFRVVHPLAFAPGAPLEPVTADRDDGERFSRHAVTTAVAPGAGCHCGWRHRPDGIGFDLREKALEGGVGYC